MVTGQPPSVVLVNTLFCFQILDLQVLFCVFLCLQALGFVRDALGRRNLAKKTLVDDRFLI